MYQALSGAEARRAALMAAAEARLSPDEIDLFRAVASVARQTSKRCNEFAHHMWGHSPDLPDALLLVDPIHFIELGVSAAIMPRLYPEHRLNIDASKLDRSNVQVYRQSDIDESVESSEKTLLIIRGLDKWIQSIGTSEPNVRIQVQLEQVPQVAQALQRLSRRNGQSTLSQERQETPPETQ
jgi:hypothetical protein